VRKTGSDKLGTRCEIKNLNSFRFMEQAIEYEAKRQIELLEDGGTVDQETRLYDPDKGETRSMRSKEDAQDYRYFPDPDLLPLVVSEKDINAIQTNLPELPDQMRARFATEYRLSAYDAFQVTATKATAVYFEETVRLGMSMSKVVFGMDGKQPVLSGMAKLAANWIMGDIASTLSLAGLDIDKCKVSPPMLAGLLARIADGTVNNKTAKLVFDALWNGEAKTADEAIEKKQLKQISDAGAIEKLVDEAIAAGAKQVADYRAGKEKALQSLVGQVMKASKGKANPAQVNEILRRKLGG
jgi:aspartyl-tRNA(Asn)/glutamyl-tRNA(Gln) amidotransferase subunit B